LKGAEDRPFLGDGFRLGRECGVLADRLRRLRQAEVEEFRAGFGEHDVAGFETAMDDALPVRDFERGRDLRAVAKDLFERKRPALQAIGERLAFDQLHDDVVQPVVVTDVVQRADVRMIQRRDRLRFTIEAGMKLRVAGQAFRKDLDGKRRD
jgi:hypothetical protein